MPKSKNDIMVHAGFLALNKRDYAQALECFQFAILEENLPAALHNLARMHQEGLGTKQDSHKAIELYEKAAKQGEIESMLSLTRIYRDGLPGIEPSLTKEFHWTQKAAEAGSAEAQHNLGVNYIHGRGVQRNNQEALQWFKKAEAQGMSESAKAIQIIQTWEHN